MLFCGLACFFSLPICVSELVPIVAIKAKVMSPKVIDVLGLRVLRVKFLRIYAPAVKLGVLVVERNEDTHGEGSRHALPLYYRQ